MRVIVIEWLAAIRDNSRGCSKGRKQGGKVPSGHLGESSMMQKGPQ
jgi:hypothetical protein